jgi:hypothetical protein
MLWCEWIGCFDEPTWDNMEYIRYSLDYVYTVSGYLFAATRKNIYPYLLGTLFSEDLLQYRRYDMFCFFVGFLCVLVHVMYSGEYDVCDVTLIMDTQSNIKNHIHLST